jgi:xanthine/uracil permease
MIIISILIGCVIGYLFAEAVTKVKNRIKRNNYGKQ